MRIRITGYPENTDRRFLCKAIRFYAAQLMRRDTVSKLNISVKFVALPGHYAQMRWIHTPDRPRSFEILVNKSMKEHLTLEKLAHEMVHVKQMATGEFRDYLSDDNIVRWKKQLYEWKEDNGAAYWFSPWEQEALGKEAGLAQLFIEYFNENK